jgi:hypothetical protein
MKRFRIVIEVETDFVPDGKHGSKPVVVPRYVVQSSWLGVFWDRHPGTSTLGYKTREDATAAIHILSTPPIYFREG